MFVSSLFLYPPEDHTWWMRLIRFAVLGLFFLLLTLWKNGGEKKPWEYKLLSFRWLLLPLMGGTLVSLIRSLLPYPLAQALMTYDMIYLNFFLWCLLFYFGLSFLVSFFAKKLWKRLLPVIFVAATDFVLLMITMFAPRKSYFVDSQAFAQFFALRLYLPLIVCNLVFMLLGFFLGRLWAKKKEKKEPQVLEEAV